MISATEARLRSEATKEELFNSELNNIQNEIEEAISEGKVKVKCVIFDKI